MRVPRFSRAALRSSSLGTFPSIADGVRWCRIDRSSRLRVERRAVLAAEGGKCWRRSRRLATCVGHRCCTTSRGYWSGGSPCCGRRPASARPPCWRTSSRVKAQGLVAGWISLDEDDAPNLFGSCLASAFEHAGLDLARLNAHDAWSSSPAVHQMGMLAGALELHAAPCLLVLDEVDRLPRSTVQLSQSAADTRPGQSPPGSGCSGPIRDSTWGRPCDAPEVRGLLRPLPRVRPDRLVGGFTGRAARPAAGRPGARTRAGERQGAPPDGGARAFAGLRPRRAAPRGHAHSRRRGVLPGRPHSFVQARGVRGHERRGARPRRAPDRPLPELREAGARGEALGLSDDELGFYDALGVNDSAVQVLGDETLCGIARELVTTVRCNVTIDWTLRLSTRVLLIAAPVLPTRHGQKTCGASRPDRARDNRHSHLFEAHTQ